jgi:hypothetical protein
MVSLKVGEKRVRYAVKKTPRHARQWSGATDRQI